MNSEIVNLYSKKLNYCIITQQSIPRKIDRTEPGFYQWLHVFPHSKLFHIRNIYPELKDGDFDIIHINAAHEDVALIPIIREKIGLNAKTVLMTSIDSPRGISYQHIKKYRDAIHSCDFIFSGNDVLSALLKKWLNRNIYSLVYPENIPWMKSLRHSRKKIDHMVRKLKKGNTSTGLGYYPLSPGDIKQIIKNPGLFTIPAESESTVLHNISFPGPSAEGNPFNPGILPGHTSVLLLFHEDTIDNSMVIFFACLGIPVIGSNEIDSMRRCFPYTAIDMKCKSNIMSMICRLYNDRYFRNLVKKTAKGNADYFDWYNSRKRLLYHICVDTVHRRFNSMTALLYHYRKDDNVNDVREKLNDIPQSPGIIGIDLNFTGAISFVRGNELKCIMKKNLDQDIPLTASQKMRKSIQHAQHNNIKVDVISLAGEYIYQPYAGVDESVINIIKTEFAGQGFYLFQSSYERAIIFSCYGISPCYRGKPCYILIIDEFIGALYTIDEYLHIRKITNLLMSPVFRYILPYYCAAHTLTDFSYHTLSTIFRIKKKSFIEYREPGEKMELTHRMYDEIDFLLNGDLRALAQKPGELSSLLGEFSIFNSGIDNPKFRNFAWEFQLQFFDTLYRGVRDNVDRSLPLIIGGSLGSHSHWRTMWHDSGLFTDIFVSPFYQDAALSLGSALDAHYYITNSREIQWDINAGEELIKDHVSLRGFHISVLNPDEIAEFLVAGAVIVWVQGKADVLEYSSCHRSIIACIHNKGFKNKINEMKLIDSSAPVPLLCIEEDIPVYFQRNYPPSPGLVDCCIKDKRLIHEYPLEKSIKIHPVHRSQNKEMYLFLTCIKEKTGYPLVFTNPLDYNRLSTIVNVVNDYHLDGMVVNNMFYKRKEC